MTPMPNPSRPLEEREREALEAAQITAREQHGSTRAIWLAARDFYLAAVQQPEREGELRAERESHIKTCTTLSEALDLAEAAEARAAEAEREGNEYREAAQAEARGHDEARKALALRTEALRELVRLRHRKDARIQAEAEGREWSQNGKEAERKDAAWDAARAALGEKGEGE